MKYLFIAYLILTLLACRNQNAKDEQRPVNDSMAMVKTIVKNDSALIFSRKLDGWIESELQKNNLDWQRLHLEEFANEEKQPTESFTPPNNFYIDYNEVLRWSPDSSYVIDIGSYGSVLVKDKQGNTHVEAGEPDTEISLINTKTNQKRSLFFVGPSSNIMNATWADTSNALILGSFDEQANNQPDTLFWLINVKENFYRMYKWKQ